jgi:hypothetical protein
MYAPDRMRVVFGQALSLPRADVVDAYMPVGARARLSWPLRVGVVGAATMPGRGTATPRVTARLRRRTIRVDAAVARVRLRVRVASPPVGVRAARARPRTSRRRVGVVVGTLALARRPAPYAAIVGVTTPVRAA